MHRPSCAAVVVGAVLLSCAAADRPTAAPASDVADVTVVDGPGAVPHVAVDGTAPFRLKSASDGAPLRWDPCTVIEVAVDPAGAPDGAVADLSTAIVVVADATGLPLVLTGTTTLDRWAGPAGLTPADDAGPQVLVAWLPGSDPFLDEDVAGRTYTSWDGRWYRSGAVVLNADLDADRPAGFAESGGRGALYLHELGHVVGLAHVDDRGQVMYPDTSASPVLGAGDRAGFAATGSGGCR